MLDAMASNDKLVRWLDLITALLRHRFAVTFEQLSRDVPDYAHEGTASETLLRMFERDKDELRKAGIAIETVAGAEGDAMQYRLRPTGFYLPYLVLQGADRAPAAPAGVGYRELPRLALAPEEAAMLRRAAERVIDLGAPPLTADAQGALRKLRYDLPESLGVPDAAPPRADGRVFAQLVDAVERGKHVTFRYHSMTRDETATRTVAPYGLVFVTGHWYLVAQEADVDGVRLFRTTRMQDVKVNAASPAARDFEVPAGFDLKAHARSRQAWELGTGDTESIVVRFTGSGGDVTAALLAGEACDGPAVRRRFQVRRRDTFLRWVLSFAGEARPESPPEVVAAWRTLLHETRAAHGARPEGA